MSFLNQSSTASPATSGSQQTLGKIVANVVEMQHQLVTQFHSVKDTIDALRQEHRGDILLLREDLRRTEDRSQKQLDEMKASHSREIERLLDIIKTLLTTNKTAETPRAPAQQQMGVPPAAFFGGINEAQRQMQDQMLQRMVLQQHMQQMQQLGGGFAAANPLFPPAAGMSPSVGITQSAGKPLITGQPAQPPVQIVSQAAVTPPKPTVHTVNLPVAEKPKVEAKLPEKRETAATSIAPQANKPTFGIPASTNDLGGIFSKPIIPTAPVVAKPEEKVQESKDDEDEVEEYEPQVEFKPVIPLPDEVAVVTGEEDEDIAFESRCKLFRFADETKEWKERGTGIIKILKDPKTKKCRIVMRRDQTHYVLENDEWHAQVHKVCANHKIQSGMTITKKGEKAVLWHCTDFAEDEPSREKLSARFESPEKADQFIKSFEAAANVGGNTPQTGTPVSTPAAKPKAQEPVDPPAAPKTEGFGDKFKIKEGQWDCPNCYTRMDASQEKCICCGTNKDGSSGGGADIFSKSAIDLQKPAAQTSTPKFSFGMAAAAAAKETPATTDAKPTLFGKGATGFSFGTGSGNSSSSSIFGGSTPAPSDENKGFGGASIFSFAKKDTPATTNTSSPVTFSFKPATSTSGDKTEAPKSIFGQTPKESTSSDKEGGAKIFGQGFGEANKAGGLSFASIGKSTGSIFSTSASPGITTTKSTFSAVTSTTDKDTPKQEENDEENDEEYEPDVDFQPVIPLPDLVDVKTGEEGEEIIQQEWARLYRFDKDNKEWKERGRGDAKILHNPSSGKYRMVMRREQVHKLCANFIITPSISFTQHEKSRNALQWMCKDFAEDINGTDEIFLMKFKTEDIAKKYLESLQNAQTE